MDSDANMLLYYLGIFAVASAIFIPVIVIDQKKKKKKKTTDLFEKILGRLSSPSKLVHIGKEPFDKGMQTVCYR